MKLIEINLLPYRELKEQKQKKQFQSLMVLAGIIGVAPLCLSLLGAYCHDLRSKQSERDLNNRYPSLR